MAPDTGVLVASILNAAYLVRHYSRGGRVAIQKEARSKAIRELGVVVRDALSQSDEYETLLAAVVDGLRPREDQPF